MPRPRIHKNAGERRAAWVARHDVIYVSIKDSREMVHTLMKHHSHKSMSACIERLIADAYSEWCREVTE